MAIAAGPEVKPLSHSHSERAGRQRPQQAPGAPGCGPLQEGLLFFFLLLLFAGAALE